MSEKEYAIVRLSDNAYMNRSTNPGGWQYPSAGPGSQGGEVFLTRREAEAVKELWEKWEPTEKFAITKPY